MFENAYFQLKLVVITAEVVAVAAILIFALIVVIIVTIFLATAIIESTTLMITSTTIIAATADTHQIVRFLSNLNYFMENNIMILLVGINLWKVHHIVLLNCSAFMS